MRVKDQEIKKLSQQIQLQKKAKIKEKKTYEKNEKSLQVLNEFDIEESINNLILANKEIYQQEAEIKNKANSFSVENIEINKSYSQNISLDFPMIGFSNKIRVRSSSKVLPKEIFSEEENLGESKNIVILLFFLWVN